ncbi:hypothetical protein [Embleya sp. NPDC005575]|uniref:hypothetical protein n=1 Tax=Embleya sp. NPDC005575 TaxID=3156892 RepID=UPI0033B2F7D2
MTTHQYPSTCRLTPHVVVRASLIEGLGLFATRPIAAGDRVHRRTGGASVGRWWRASPAQVPAEGAPVGTSVV